MIIVMLHSHITESLESFFVRLYQKKPNTACVKIQNVRISIAQLVNINWVLRTKIGI